MKFNIANVFKYRSKIFTENTKNKNFEHKYLNTYLNVNYKLKMNKIGRFEKLIYLFKIVCTSKEGVILFLLYRTGK